MRTWFVRLHFCGKKHIWILLLLLLVTGDVFPSSWHTGWNWVLLWYNKWWWILSMFYKTDFFSALQLNFMAGRKWFILFSFKNVYFILYGFLSGWFLQLLSFFSSHSPLSPNNQPTIQPTSPLPLHKMQLYFLTPYSLHVYHRSRLFSTKYFIPFFATANGITERTFVAAAPSTFLWYIVSSWMLHKAKNKQEFYLVPLAF